MRILFFISLCISQLAQIATGQAVSEQQRWKEQSLRVKIIRDNWGIAHVYGKSDADAVFGMLYAQCEDDFDRVERNYLTATARQAEAFGEEYVFHDLRIRLFQDSIMALQVYKNSPAWLKQLCNAFADGINYYLYTHPAVKPKLIKRFQPWMPFLFSEGSIGGNIASVSLDELRAFYGQSSSAIESKPGGDALDDEPRGSNGFAIAPSLSANKHALLLINPHTTFYFRSEIHVNSEEGLSAYGAVTWGQFFIYQGFNERCGWMHTTSKADAVDEYAETGGVKGGQFYFNYGNAVKQGTTAKVVIKYKSGDRVLQKSFNTYFTQHGPVVAKRADKWITVRLMREPMKALTQSFTRTKAKSFADFEKTMEFRTNSSNNTVYADADGNIAYWHGNFIPKRDIKFDWSKPVDGSNPETEWKGLHNLNEIITLKNPPTGWIQNCNSTPFAASGSASPKATSYPGYMAPDFENPRGLHAVRVLRDSNSFTVNKLIQAAYDSYLPTFERMIPELVKAFDGVASDDSVRLMLTEPMQRLRNWNYRFSAASIETTVAIYWARQLEQMVSSQLPSVREQWNTIDFLAKKTSAPEKITALSLAIQELQNDFGTWKQPWGEVNRFQRLTGNFEQTFDDNQPSLAIPFTSAFWGSLASFGAERHPGTKKMYGYVGNSFVAVVEFGKKITAKSVVTGGSSSDPSSPNFSDQAARYAQGQFKDVLFYYDDVMKNAVKVYYPAE